MLAFGKTFSSFKMSKLFLLVFIFIFIVVGGLNFYLQSEKKQLYKNLIQNTPKLGNVTEFKEDILCKNQDLDKCLKSVKLVQQNSLEKIYTYLDSLIVNKVMVSTKCHSISHDIGENYYKINGDLTKVLELDLRTNINDLNCLSGFYHGAMIQAMKNQEQGNIGEIEKPFLKYQNPKDYLEADILHGVGHAFFAYYGDFEESLDLCKKHSLSVGQRYLCNSGVFMQFFFDSGEYGLATDIEFCDKFSGEHKFSCISAYIPQDFSEKKFSTIFLEYCSKLEDADLQTTCFDRNFKNYTSTRFSAMERYRFMSSIYASEQLANKIKFLAIASYSNNANFCALGNMYEYFSCRNLLAKYAKNSLYVFIPESIVLGEKVGKFF